MELRTDARVNHERIVEAARAAFAEQGLGVEMREIADRAGVAVGTIYRHFPSKEDLLTAIGRALLAEAAVDADRCAAISQPLEALASLVAGNLQRAERFGWLAAVFIGGRLPRHHLDELRREMEAQGVRRRFQPLLRRGVDDGYLRGDLDVEVAAAMLEGATAPWSCTAVSAGRDWEEVAQGIMTTFLQGALRRSALFPRSNSRVRRPAAVDDTGAGTNRLPLRGGRTTRVQHGKAIP